MALAVTITPASATVGQTLTAVITGTTSEIGLTLVPWKDVSGADTTDFRVAAAPFSATDTLGAVWTVTRRTSTSITATATARR